MHVAGLLVDVLERDGTGAALFVERCHRLRGKLLGLDDGRHRARVKV